MGCHASAGWHPENQDRASEFQPDQPAPYQFDQLNGVTPGKVAPVKPETRLSKTGTKASSIPKYPTSELLSEEKLSNGNNPGCNYLDETK
jgi:hypothetical protein